MFSFIFLIHFKMLSFYVAGKENRAYVSDGGVPTGTSSRPTSAAGGKWANNYVPYGDFPKGLKEVSNANLRFMT